MSNALRSEVAQRLVRTDILTDALVSTILGKLGLAQSEEDHRRVLAVLAYRRATSPEQPWGRLALTELNTTST